MPCFLANSSALVRSRAEIACKMTSGCDLAGMTRHRGLSVVSRILNMAMPGKYVHAMVETYAVWAAPKMPNRMASLFFSGIGGLKDVKTR